MLTAYRNALLNPKFDLIDYGTTARTTTGFVATRWKFEAVGTGVSVAPGTTDSASGIPKWIRSRPCLDAVVSAATYDPATHSAIIRQRMPDADRFGQNRVRLSVVAFGPEDGSFNISVGGRSKTLYTLGTTAGGTPRHSVQHIEEVLPDPSVAYLPVEIFSAPADLDGTYKIAFAQLQFLHNAQIFPDNFELRNVAIERLLCARYLWPCPRGFQASTLAGGTQIFVPIWTPVEMNAAPSVVAGADPVTWMQGSTGTTFNASPPTFTGSTTHTRGGRIIIGGFAGLPAAASLGQIDSERAVLLEAELG